MTMIRINLIAERKAGAPKAVKKTSEQQSEIQENLILIVLVLAAAGIVYLMVSNLNGKLRAEQARFARLDQQYNSLKKYEQEQEDYEIQKELLNEKITKISDLKDLREGPVKLMEDVANALPESAWLVSIWQGFDANLAKATRSQGRVIVPGGGSRLEPALVKVEGLAKTADAVTNFTDRIQKLDVRYYDTELNNYAQVEDSDDGSREFKFEIFFKVRRGSPQPQNEGGQQP